METFIPMTPEELLAYAAKTPPPVKTGLAHTEYHVKSLYPSIYTVGGAAPNDAPATFDPEALSKWARATGWTLTYEDAGEGTGRLAKLAHEGAGFRYKITLERLLDPLTSATAKCMAEGRLFVEYGLRGRTNEGRTNEVMTHEERKKPRPSAYKVIRPAPSSVPLPYNFVKPPAFPSPPKTLGRYLEEALVFEGRKWLDLGHGVRVALMLAPYYVGEVEVPASLRVPAHKAHKAEALLYIYVDFPSPIHAGERSVIFALRRVTDFDTEHKAPTKAKAMWGASIPPARIEDMNGVRENLGSASHAATTREAMRALVADTSKSLPLKPGQRFRGFDLHKHLSLNQRYLDAVKAVGNENI